MANQLEYQIHISLLDVHPTVWRRFTVPSNITFKKLHEVIQVVIGWSGEHLFEFKFGPMKISIPDEEAGESFAASKTNFDARRKKLSTMNFEADDFLTYTYDFGDNWVHLIRIEEIYPAEQLNAICLKGENACPPEDVGGVPGFAHFLEALRDPTHPEHRDMQEWSGGHYDATHFDIDGVNAELQALRVVKVKSSSPLPAKRIYEILSDWSSIPDLLKDRILSNVWCGHCGDVTTMTDYEVKKESMETVLEGKCSVCGHFVARVL